MARYLSNPIIARSVDAIKIYNKISHDILKTRRGRFGETDKCIDSKATRKVQNQNVRLSGQSIDLNKWKYNTVIKTIGPPPMNPTQVLLGEYRSPM